MNSNLRILLVEDSLADATVIEHELARAGLEPKITRAETEAEIHAELLRGPDLILTDYSLPGFTAIDVLDWFHQKGGDAPVILVSGTIDTETAVATMRKGAFDYLLKGNLSGLSGAVHRAMDAKRLRKEKAAAEERAGLLSRMLDLAHDAIIVSDFDRGCIQYWNRGAEKLYGMTAEEVMGEPLDEVLKTTGIDESVFIKSLLRNGEWSAETYRKLRDGRDAIVSERATLIRDGEGRPTAILFIHYDITEQHAAEEQVQYQKLLLRETGEFAKIGSWEINVVSGAVYWTPEISRIFGLAPDHETSMEIGMRFFHGEYRRRLESVVNAAINDARPYDIELQIIAADRTPKWIRAVGHPVLLGEKVVRVCGIIQDINEQRRAQERLRDQARLLDLATDAIVVSDFATGEIIYWNQGAERLHGWKAAEVLGQSAIDVLLSNARDADEITRAITANGEWSGELRERAKDGREIIVSSRLTLVHDHEGRPQSLLAIHTDVTERKTLESQFLRAQRLESVGTLASGIAHDLNNILSPIILAGPMLDGDLPPDLRKTIVQTINTSARRGVEIVRQVLTFARGVKGQLRPVNCEHLISEIASIAGETFPKSISITSKAKMGLWSALGDSTQLQQVVLNLAINARDAMPNGGSLSITGCNFVVDDSYASMISDAKPGPHVLLAVADTGVGIPKGMIDKIFDPFFTTKEIGKGTGLGLSSVLGIIKNHGGFVAVESEPNRGTTFKVFIPAAIRDVDPGYQDAGAPAIRGRGELILLVEDEANIRTAAEIILQRAGYHVLLAADGTEALSRYMERRGEIQVVLTDAVMPFLDGASLIRALRNLDPKLKVIGTSGHEDDVRTNELKTLGLQGFLPKPYETQTLLTTLDEILHPLNP